MTKYVYGTKLASVEYEGAIYRAVAKFPSGNLQRAGLDISYDNGLTWNGTDHPAIRLSGTIATDEEWCRSNLSTYIKRESFSDLMHSCYVGRHWECESRTVAPHSVCACKCHHA